MARATDIPEGGESSGFLGGIDLESLMSTLIYKFIDFVEAVLIILVSLVIIRMIRRYLMKMEATHDQQKTAIELVDKLVSGFIMIVAITVALKVLGIDMTLLVSVLILGLSYGLQDVIKNYVAGIIIMFKSPFKVGDAIKVDKFIGRVVKIDFQSTQLKTWDNKMITIYNAKLLKKEITNYYKLPIRRMQLKFKFGYGTNLEILTEKIMKICSTIPEILDKPKTKVIYKEYDGEGVTLEVRFWVKYPSDILTTNTKVAAGIHKLYSDKIVYMPFIKGIELGEDHSKETRDKAFDKYEQELEAAEPVEKITVEGVTPELVQEIETDYDAE